jgi:hypothetical protein
VDLREDWCLWGFLILLASETQGRVNKWSHVSVNTVVTGAVHTANL